MTSPGIVLINVIPMTLMIAIMTATIAMAFTILASAEVGGIITIIPATASIYLIAADVVII